MPAVSRTPFLSPFRIPTSNNSAFRLPTSNNSAFRIHPPFRPARAPKAECRMPFLPYTLHLKPYTQFCRTPNTESQSLPLSEFRTPPSASLAAASGRGGARRAKSEVPPYRTTTGQNTLNPAFPASCPVVLWGRSPNGEAPSSKGEEGNL